MRRPGWAGIRRPGWDCGSSIPFVLLCFLLAAFLVFGVTAASSAFLAQRDLQADCDGAAVAAAAAVDPSVVYDGNLTGSAALPLASEQAQAALNDYQARTFLADPTLSMTADVDAARVTVTCHRVVRVPFGGLFGAGDGLSRSTVSTARSPLRP